MIGLIKAILQLLSNLINIPTYINKIPLYIVKAGSKYSPLSGGVYLGWSLGANDAANVFGIAISARVIKYWTAIILLSLLVIVGAYLEGPKCMVTIKNTANILPETTFLTTVSAALTMTILTIWAIPASTSQAIVGSIIGASLAMNLEPPNWDVVLKIVICWIGTPLGAIFISVFLYVMLLVTFGEHFNIKEHDKSLKTRVKFINVISRYIFRMVLFLTVLLPIILGKILNKIMPRLSERKFQRFFKFWIIVSGIYGAYTLGANNVANVTGVFFASGLLSATAASIIGGLSIAFGALTFSRRVIKTVGFKITYFDLPSAFVATLSQALTVHFYTQIGVPVSTSQAVVGAVVGIGLIRGIEAFGRKKVFQILLGWLFTPLSALIISYIAVSILKFFM